MRKFDVFSNKFSHDIFLQKYSMDQQETWDQLCKRVVNSVCGQLLTQEQQNEIMQYMIDRKFIPGGRYLYSSGRPWHQVNNCFLFRAEDSREGWGELSNKVSCSLMSGGGIGVDYSSIREKGSIIKKTGGIASGPLSLMKIINETGREVMNGGFRRAAIWGGLVWSHPDIFDFINMKNHSEDLRMMKRKDLNFPLPMELTNISVIYDTEFYVAIENEKHPKHSLAKRVWFENCRQAFSTAEPGMSFNYCKDLDSLRNAPISGNTYVLTDGGYKQVLDIVNKEITIWTGQQWATTVFKKTRENDETVKVILTGRKEIICSKDHQFILASGERIDAINLVPGQELKTQLGIVYNGIKNNNAYLLGCIYGDGCFHKKYPRAELALCSNKKELFNRIIENSDLKPLSHSETRKGVLRLYYGNNELFSNRNKSIFPEEIYSWDFNSRKEFLEGLLDTDGNDNAGFARLSSKHFNFLKCVGRLAESIGLTVALNKGSNGGYIGTPTWNLIIKGNIDNINTSRLKLKSVPNIKHKVVSIEKSDNQDVFCCDVGVEEHSFQAEGIIISNCCEITSEDDSDKCNLGTVWMNRCKNKLEFGKVVRASTLFLLCGGIYSDIPTEKIKEVGLKNNRIGLGLGGMHEWLMVRGLPYEVNDEMHKWLRVYEQESNSMAYIGAKQLGVAIPKGKRAIAPNGSIGILSETTTGIEPLICKAYKRRYFDKGVWKYQYVIDGTVKRLLDSGVKIENIQDAYEITFEQRVKFQADVQNYVDMSISSTCNLSQWGSEKNNEGNLLEHSEMLLKYSKRLRGFTCYPDGCRDGQPFERVELEEAMKDEGTIFEENTNCPSGVCGV